LPEKIAVIQSPLSPDALLDLLRTGGSLKCRTELPAELQAVGVRGATFKVGKDATFRVVLDGVRANGKSGASVEGRGRITSNGEGRGSEIVLTIGPGSITRWTVVLVCAFCYGSDVGFRLPNSVSVGSLVVTTAGALFLLFFVWVEVTRLSNQLWPGLVSLVEGLGMGSLLTSSEVATRAPTK